MALTMARHPGNAGASWVWAARKWTFLVGSTWGPTSYNALLAS